MSRRAALPLGLWLAGLALAAVFAARTRYVADMSAFLPAHPTAEQRLLTDLLRSGPASKTILIALDGGSAPARARLSEAIAARLRGNAAFLSVANGDAADAGRGRAFLFEHRYLLSAAVTPRRFTVAGLHEAIAATIDELTTPAGPWLKSLLPRDPTGEVLHIAGQWSGAPEPRTQDGVWTSASGARAVLVAQLRASGSDTDAEQRAIDAIHAAYRHAAQGVGAAGHRVRLELSGPPVFAVAAREKIQHAAFALSLIGSVLVVTLLLAVYRSAAVVLLGLLPVLTGALAGIAGVAAKFGYVHGLTLGFGITLIGEAVDYSIYYFIQSGRAAGVDGTDGGAASWRGHYWPTVRLGAITSICGFAALASSGFTGLAQLGVYSICGIVAAALTTRFVLPEIAPRGLRVRNVAPAGLALGARLPAAGVARGLAITVSAGALVVLWLGRGHVWNHQLAALSPVSAADRAFDASLRTDLGAADVRDIVVATGADQQAALRAAENTARALTPLVHDGALGGFDSPANYLPSIEVQRARRASLPDAATLTTNLQRATADLPIRSQRLAAFVADVAAARSSRALRPADLAGTPFAIAFDALMVPQHRRWIALLPLHAPIDLPRVRTAVGGSARVVDLKAAADGLYAGYLRQAIDASGAGFVAIALLLTVALRSPRRALRVLAPLAVAVLAVAAGLVQAGVRLTMLHLVGMLLIVAIGSNYSLFFERHGRDADRGAMLGSLAVANAATVIGFGLLTLADVPVLRDLGMTVAPGALLALLFAALLARR